ncbi:MAG: NAD-dependent epimerase/dehydratase family protein [Anaerolineae bacterium]
MKLFITGGAGFIGSNSADAFLKQGHEVALYDNLSRTGCRANVTWLRRRHGERVCLVEGDVRDYDRLAAAIAGTDVVLHLASQVAVTTSVENPREDFEINALGTFNVLEAVRHHCPEAAVIYASTNKVYGGMESVRIALRDGRYEYVDFQHGIPESYPLDFHSPYGCSKGTGDQYMLDYARIYGLKTLVFRQSCIYGRRQFGVEDQGWVAHFVIAAVLNRPIHIFGDGKQVRDVLHVSDLIRAYGLGIEKMDELRGEVFNLGGGPEHTLSVWSEFGPLLESLAHRPVPVTYHEWRPGDQRVFVADIRKAAAVMGWRPEVAPRDGIRDLYDWVQSNPALFADIP